VCSFRCSIIWDRRRLNVDDFENSTNAVRTLRRRAGFAIVMQSGFRSDTCYEGGVGIKATEEAMG